MIAYVDSSVVLRLVLGQPGALAEWKDVERAVGSALAEVECLRTLDRLRILDKVSDAQLAAARAAVFDVLDTFEIVEVSQAVLDRAAQPMPTLLATLDAIHLSTALLWRARAAADLVVATHDGEFATAARAHGFRVVGA